MTAAWEDVANWRILIVDDDVDNLGVITQYLTFLGAQVRTARDGEEGLLVLDIFSPTAILADLSMPNMDGWEMLKRVRADSATASIPVIAVTAHAMSSDEERVRAAGFDSYITKPFMLTTFLSDVRRCLAEAANHHASSAKTDPSTGEANSGTS